MFMITNGLESWTKDMADKESIIYGDIKPALDSVHFDRFKGVLHDKEVTYETEYLFTIFDRFVCYCRLDLSYSVKRKYFACFNSV